MAVTKKKAYAFERQFLFYATLYLIRFCFKMCCLFAGVELEIPDLN